MPPIGPTRKAVATTPVNTVLFSGSLTLAAGLSQVFKVEVDGATSSLYSGSGFTPIPPDLASAYVSTMGFLLSIFGSVNGNRQVVAIDQARNGGSAWLRIRTDLLMFSITVGAPYLQRGIPIVGSFARITLTNNLLVPATWDPLVIKVLSA
jgi:hypothetical protein